MPSRSTDLRAGRPMHSTTKQETVAVVLACFILVVAGIMWVESSPTRPPSILLWRRQGTLKGHLLSGTRRTRWRFLRSDLDAKLTAPSVALSNGRIQ
jgi:hypothetical protein